MSKRRQPVRATHATHPFATASHQDDRPNEQGDAEASTSQGPPIPSLSLTSKTPEAAKAKRSAVPKPATAPPKPNPFQGKQELDELFKIPKVSMPDPGHDSGLGCHYLLEGMQEYARDNAAEGIAVPAIFPYQVCFKNAAAKDAYRVKTLNKHAQGLIDVEVLEEILEDMKYWATCIEALDWWKSRMGGEAYFLVSTSPRSNGLQSVKYKAARTDKERASAIAQHHAGQGDWHVVAVRAHLPVQGEPRRFDIFDSRYGTRGYKIKDNRLPNTVLRRPLPMPVAHAEGKLSARPRSCLDKRLSSMTVPFLLRPAAAADPSSRS